MTSKSHQRKFKELIEGKYIEQQSLFPRHYEPTFVPDIYQDAFRLAYESRLDRRSEFERGVIGPIQSDNNGLITTIKLTGANFYSDIFISFERLFQLLGEGGRNVGDLDLDEWISYRLELLARADHKPFVPAVSVDGLTVVIRDQISGKLAEIGASRNTLNALKEAPVGKLVHIAQTELMLLRFSDTTEEMGDTEYERWTNYFQGFSPLVRFIT
jgi:hypothetical protein